MPNVPDRVAAMLAAQSDAARCYEILEAEIRKALARLAEGTA